MSSERSVLPRWWRLLYFVGNGPLIAALRDHAPLGNPIRVCLDAVVSGAPSTR